MSGLVIPIATAALPYVVKGVSTWVNAAVKTYAPPAVAGVTIKGAEATGSQLFGGSGILGKIGGVAGKAFGWVAAPLVAQSIPVQSNVLMSGEFMGPALGALIQVGGNYLMNSKQSPKAPEVPVFQQMMMAQQLQASQLHAQWEAQMKAQMPSSQIDAKQMLEFVNLVQAKKGEISINDLEEFLKHQDGKVDINQLLQMIQLIKGVDNSVKK